MPQQFMLVPKDSMKAQNAEFGGEREIRNRLLEGGISQIVIDKLFEEAKCKRDTQSISQLWTASYGHSSS
jgi:SOS response regulatory protein OraA/RecX